MQAKGDERFEKQISSGAVINIAGILVGAVLNLWLLPNCSAQKS